MRKRIDYAQHIWEHAVVFILELFCCFQHGHIEPKPRHVYERPTVHLCRVGIFYSAVKYCVRRAFNVLCKAHHLCKIVARAERQYGKHGIRAYGCGGYLVNGAVSADGSDEPFAALYCGFGKRGSVARGRGIVEGEIHALGFKQL